MSEDPNQRAVRNALKKMLIEQGVPRPTAEEAVDLGMRACTEVFEKLSEVCLRAGTVAAAELTFNCAAALINAQIEAKLTAQRELALSEGRQVFEREVVIPS